MHHNKHQQKRHAIFPFLFIVIILFLVGIEAYLLFFQPEKKPQSATAETTHSEQQLNFNASQLKNFNQEVQPTAPLAVDMNKQLIDSDFVGTALVVHEGQIILQQGYGYSNFETKKKNNSQSLFQIGSMQKAYTAVLILQQIQANKLSLDTTLDTYYPNVPYSSQITIRHLLKMTSGLYQEDHPKSMMSDDDFIRYNIAHAKMGKFNSYRYSGINYNILVGILEKITNTPYKSLFNQEYRTKVSLSNTIFYDEFIKSPNRTYSYEKKDGKDYAEKNKDDSVLFDQEVGTGNVAATTGDIYTFFSDLFSNQFLTSAMMDTIWNPDSSGKYIAGTYDFGSYIFSHGIEGDFEAAAFISKNQKESVILLTNQHIKNDSLVDLNKKLFLQLDSYKIK